MLKKLVSMLDSVRVCMHRGTVAQKSKPTWWSCMAFSRSWNDTVPDPRAAGWGCLGEGAQPVM